MKVIRSGRDGTGKIIGVGTTTRKGPTYRAKALLVRGLLDNSIEHLASVISLRLIEITTGCLVKINARQRIIYFLDSREISLSEFTAVLLMLYQSVADKTG
ncbi:MAG: hypothetical protein V3U65_19430 [Granulosicoccaceae bacterium]